MNLNKHQEHINTTDLSDSNDNTFNIEDENILIKKECDSLIKNIDSIIKVWFLQKEYYPNPTH